MVLLFCCLSSRPALAGRWDGEGAERLRTFLANLPRDQEYALVQVAAEAMRLLSDPGDAAAVDSAVVLLTDDLPGFTSTLAPARAAELRTLLGLTELHRFERYDRAVPLLTAAVATLDEADASGDLWYETASGLAEAHFFQFHSDRVLDVATVAHRRAIAADEPVWQGRFAKWIAQALGQEDRLAEAEPYLREVVALAEAGGRAWERFDAYQTLGAHLYRRGRTAEGLAYARWAVGVAAPETRQRAYGLLQVGIGLTNTGQLAAAIDTLALARGDLDHHGERDDRVHVRFELARATREAGDYPRAAALIDSAMAATAGVVTPYHTLYRDGEMTEVYVGLGDFERALASYRAFRRQERSLDSLSNDRTMLALAQRYEGERDAALLGAQADYLRERRAYRYGLATMAALWFVGLGVVLYRSARGRASGRRHDGNAASAG